MSQLADEIGTTGRAMGHPVQIMEVCGTHTVAVFRSGIRSLLPANVRLVSGPGCPVCVTAQGHIDAAIRLSGLDDVTVATYGDMVRVPGRLGSLEHQRARGADVRVVNSARSALRLAEQFPDKQVVFLGVGFETTAPATAAAILEARQRGLHNFAVFTAHKLIVPAMLALLEGGDVPLDGFLCPGHVSVIIGCEAYRPVVERYGKTCVVAGFEPEGILAAILSLLRQIERHDARLENAYEPIVRPEGNVVAKRLMEQVFRVAPSRWRGLGIIPASGLELRADYEAFDAAKRFNIEIGDDAHHPSCRCGEVICGKVTPDQCRLFGTTCTPVKPVGPCMVSSEGTCSAWFKYGSRCGEVVRTADHTTKSDG
jgi:hydrogenase expression/formation protein HypD